MTTIIERIKHISEIKGVSIRQIEASIGASNGVISNALSRGSDIQAKWLSKIIDTYVDINADWLLTGRGEPLKTNKGEPKPYGSILQEPPPGQIHKESGQCKLCNEKEKRIEDLKKLIKTQEEYIEHLKGHRLAEDDKPGQKRKAG